MNAVAGVVGGGCDLERRMEDSRCEAPGLVGVVFVMATVHCGTLCVPTNSQSSQHRDQITPRSP